MHLKCSNKHLVSRVPLHFHVSDELMGLNFNDVASLCICPPAGMVTHRYNMMKGFLTLGRRTNHVNKDSDPGDNAACGRGRWNVVVVIVIVIAVTIVTAIVVPDIHVVTTIRIVGVVVVVAYAVIKFSGGFIEHIYHMLSYNVNDVGEAGNVGAAWVKINVWLVLIIPGRERNQKHRVISGVIHSPMCSLNHVCQIEHMIGSELVHYR